MTQPDPFASGRSAMIRSSSHSHFRNLQIAHESENTSTGSPIGPSSAEQPAAFDDLASSWPPPRYSAAFSEARKQKQKLGDRTRGSCFIPCPDDDDYGRSLKSRLAVQRLAPTASPKAKECALLLRSVSSLSTGLPSPPSQPFGGVNSLPESPDRNHRAPLDKAANPRRQHANEALSRVIGFPSKSRLESAASDPRPSLEAREAFDLNESSALSSETADLVADKALLESLSRPPFPANPTSEERTPHSRTIDLASDGSCDYPTGPLHPSNGSTETPPLGSPFQPFPNPSTKHLPPKPNLGSIAEASKPAIAVSARIADVSMSGSGPNLPKPFQGPPGFPGANGSFAPPSSSLPLPPDEYGDLPPARSETGDPLLAINEYGDPSSARTNGAGMQRNPILNLNSKPNPKLNPHPKLNPNPNPNPNLKQQLIRGIHMDESAKNRLHLSSSVNELLKRDSDRVPISGARSSSSRDEDGSSLGEGDDESEGSGRVLWKTTSLPQGYLDRYLVPNDEEVEYEREEAGIGKNSPRPSPLSRAPPTSNGATSTPHKRPRLILHLDINKTILIKDTAQDAGSDSMVNVLLSECAWGRLLPGPCWIPVGRLATDKPANDPELMTYRSYLDTFYLPLQRGFGPEIDRTNEDIKHRRQALKRCFTAPGEPGAMFRGVYDKLLDELRVAEPMQAEMRACGLGNGKELVLLPSFFELIKHLKNSGRDFAIVFRTFGSDVMDVSKELNLFCEGRHPYHPGVLMNGQDGPTDLRLRTLDSYGCFYRQGFGPEGTLLAFGPPEEALRKHIARLDELEKCAECHWSFRAIYNAIIARCIEGGNIALAFRDYYPWWKAHQERARTGKLLLVDKEDVNTRQVFFDDNIGTGSPHIVDVRDVSTGEPVPFSEASGKYLVKVEPMHAILDRQYFIRAVHRCEESIEGALDWRGFRDAPRSKNSKWDVARRKLLSIIRLGAGQH